MPPRAVVGPSRRLALDPATSADWCISSNWSMTGIAVVAAHRRPCCGGLRLGDIDHWAP